MLTASRILGTEVGSTFPDLARPWALPRGWHADYGWDLAPEPLFGVKVFAFFAEVRPRGGTMVITGSHRVLARFAASLPPLAAPAPTTTPDRLPCGI